MAINTRQIANSGHRRQASLNLCTGTMTALALQYTVNSYRPTTFGIQHDIEDHRHDLRNMLPGVNVKHAPVALEAAAVCSPKQALRELGDRVLR